MVQRRGYDLNRGDRSTPETSGVLRDIGSTGVTLRGSIPFALKRVALHAPGWRAAARVGYARVTDFRIAYDDPAAHS